MERGSQAVRHGTGEWARGMNKANLRPCWSIPSPNRTEQRGREGGQIGEQSMLRRRQIVAIHLVQSGSDEIMVRCNGPRDEKRGVEWAIFQEWAERRRRRRREGGRIAELNHVGNWISYKNATLAVSLFHPSPAAPAAHPYPPQTFMRRKFCSRASHS